MTDKPLSETTDNELLIELVNTQKASIADLKEELAKKQKPFFDFKNLRGIFSDFWYSDAAGVLLVIAIVLGCIFPCIYMAVTSGAQGKFYVEYHGTTSYSQPPKCEVPAPIVKPCYKVMQEFKWGQDDSITNCISDRDEAHEVASKFLSQWKELNNE